MGAGQECRGAPTPSEDTLGENVKRIPRDKIVPAYYVRCEINIDIDCL